MALAQRALGRRTPASVLLLGIDRRRAVLRRRRDHAGDLGAVGRRGPEARDAGLRATSSCRSPSSSWSRCSPCRARGTAQVAALFGPIMVVWFVAHRGRRRCCTSVDDPRVLAALNPLYGVGSCSTTAMIGLVDARRGVPGGHRRARRSTPTWAISAASRSRPPGSAWCCRRCSQLFRPGRAAAAPIRTAIENPFFLLYPGLGCCCRWSSSRPPPPSSPARR